jgi:hypothetical protein
MLQSRFVVLMQAAGFFFLLQQKTTALRWPRATGKERIRALGELLLALLPNLPGYSAQLRHFWHTLYCRPDLLSSDGFYPERQE